ncbi:hypothetical protein [Amycolatopsis sp. cg9]|uniref:hypothetical protein n=1 Tax=Amycolatopsis sp. cg9 TaxID=3238801 RepID=UPI00352357FE
MLSQALTALEQLLVQQRQTGTLLKVSPPAQDPASVAYNARLINGTGVFTAAGDHVSAEATYLHELVAKIRHAFGIVGDGDSAAAGDVGRAAIPQGSVAG